MSGAFSSKALKALGLTPARLISAFLGQKQGQLTADEYFMFWGSVETSRESERSKVVGLYLSEMIQKLVAMVAGTADDPYPVQALINAVCFVCLNCPRTKSKDPKIVEALQTWDDAKARLKLLNPSADEVLRLVRKEWLEGSAGIDSMVVQASSLHSAEEVQILSDAVRCPTIYYLLTNPTTGAFSFFYPNLKRMASSDPEQVMPILKSLSGKLRTLRAQMRVSPELAQQSLLALLHMLRQFISLHRVTDGAFVQQVTLQLQPFTLWPSPYGDAVRATLTTLRRESLAPGNELFKRFATESKVPEIRGFDVEGSKSRPVFYLIDRNEPETQGLATVMYLGELPAVGGDAAAAAAVAASGSNSASSGPISSSSRAAAAVAAVSSDPSAAETPASAPTPDPEDDEEEDDEPVAGLSSKTTAMLLLCALEHDLELEDAVFDAVQHLTEDDVDQLFGSTIMRLSQALKLDPESAKAFRVEQLGTVKAQLVATAERNKAEGVDPADCVQLPPDEIPETLQPSLPPLSHVMLPCEHAYRHPSRARLEELGYCPPPTTAAQASLERLLGLLAPHAEPDEPATCRVVVAGGNRALHQTVCAYTALSVLKPAALRGVAFQFFLAPFARSDMAAFIARHDGWYNRHVYTPFASDMFMLPHLRHDEGMQFHQVGDLDVPLPGKFLRECAADYVREANAVYEASVWSVECWEHSDREAQKLGLMAVKSKKKTRRGTSASPSSSSGAAAEAAGVDTEDSERIPDKQFPWVTRLAVGELADAIEFQKTNSLKSVREALQHKNFSPTFPDVQMQLVPVDASGRSKPAQEEEPAVFRAIQFSNVPCEADLCFPSEPHKDWLEMHVSFPDKKAKTAITSPFTRDPRQHIRECVITGSGLDAKFRIVIDGTVFGPFHKIRVAPMMDRIPEAENPGAAMSSPAGSPVPTALASPPRTPPGSAPGSPSGRKTAPGTLTAPYVARMPPQQLKFPIRTFFPIATLN